MPTHQSPVSLDTRKIKTGDLKIKKVLGTENPADLMTKAVTAEILKGHLKKMNIEPRGGRATKAHSLNAVMIKKKKGVTDMHSNPR